ncbi:MAG: nicotinate (nicotinamide) nucleotide adenylyltransferase [Planctomycetes bacterium]|nr:nicotinate (nicotinamide) nucleotide adenylyltransferase [Planctomycetota bacterium]
MTPAPAQPGAPTTRPGIAILGGSFNPPHRTHLRLVDAALRALPVDEVRVLPAGDHPHKRGGDLAPAAARLAMCRLAFADRPGVVVDDRELHRPGPSFTVDTLAELAAEAPGRPLFFLIGSDNLPLLPTWRDHHRVLALATVVTYPRRGHPIDAEVLAGLDLSAAERGALLANVLAGPADEVAASDLRRRWRRGERDLVEIPAAVRAYMATSRCYDSGIA